MFILDTHLDLSMNALEWNRDLTWSVKDIRKSEEGMTDKPDRKKNTVSLDASHLCELSFWETMKVYEGPVWASHNNCRKFADHNRQYSDEQIKNLLTEKLLLERPWMPG